MLHNFTNKESAFKGLTQGYTAVTWQNQSLPNQFLKLTQSLGPIFKIQLWPGTKHVVQPSLLLVETKYIWVFFFFGSKKFLNILCQKELQRNVHAIQLCDANLHNLAKTLGFYTGQEKLLWKPPIIVYFMS